MNLLKKIIYFCLKLQERQLEVRLDKHLKTFASNKTSKIHLSSNVTVTLNAETQKNRDLVQQAIQKIVSETKNNPNLLLEYIKANNTKVTKLKNADKALALIKESTGFIPEQRGFEALYLNILTDSGLGLKSKPIFILNEDTPDPYFVLYHFYKWYSLSKGLPGFDFKSQNLLKQYFNSNKQLEIEKLTLDEMTGLKEAIDRDNEAIDFTVNYAKSIDGSKNIIDKINSQGSAEI